MGGVNWREVLNLNFQAGLFLRAGNVLTGDHLRRDPFKMIVSDFNSNHLYSFHQPSLIIYITLTFHFYDISHSILI